VNKQRISELVTAQHRQPLPPGLHPVSATIVEWNPDTAENVILYDGELIPNVPSYTSPDQLSWQPGDEVHLLINYPQSGRRRGGFGSPVIWGRIARPGTEAATNAIAFMQSTLVSALIDDLVAALLVSPAGVELAQFVNAQLIKTAVDLGQTTTSSTTFGDGSAAGPAVTDVQVTSTGRCLVLWGAAIDAGPRTDGGQIGGNMSVAISGASTVAASINHAHQLSQSVTVTGASWSHRIGGRSLVGSLFEGLNPGAHTITGKYASGVSGETVAFANRLIIAIAY
jgi:hypothetical protein